MIPLGLAKVIYVACMIAGTFLIAEDDEDVSRHWEARVLLLLMVVGVVATIYSSEGASS